MTTQDKNKQALDAFKVYQRQNTYVHPVQDKQHFIAGYKAALTETESRNSAPELVTTTSVPVEGEVREASEYLLHSITSGAYTDPMALVAFNKLRAATKPAVPKEVVEAIEITLKRGRMVQNSDQYMNEVITANEKALAIIEGRGEK